MVSQSVASSTYTGAFFTRLTPRRSRRPKLFRPPFVQAGVPRFLAELPRRSFLALMLAGSALITASSLAYFDFETLPPFVIEKLPVRFESLWLASLRIHVASALVAFPLCLLLTTRALQRRPAWHRWLGRITGAMVLFALVPSGVVLAFDAKGGSIVTSGFLLSAAIVGWCTVGGVQAARRRDFVSHRRAMRHVVAQMSVAVTSRAMLVGLDMAGVDPGVSYVLALWGPVLASAAVAELVSSRFVFPVPNPVQFIGRIRREVSSLALPGRQQMSPRSSSAYGAGSSSGS
jgi:uncharacterized membrane protein YozB (DUF420 family)